MIYIPYGSDKTHNNEEQLKSFLQFISHMVQIKLSCFLCMLFAIKIYIPYGSDKTLNTTLLKSASYLIYIPYGSDKTYTTTVKEPTSSYLYPIWFR